MLKLSESLSPGPLHAHPVPWVVSVVLTQPHVRVSPTQGPQGHDQQQQPQRSGLHDDVCFRDAWLWMHWPPCAVSLYHAAWPLLSRSVCLGRPTPAPAPPALLPTDSSEPRAVAGAEFASSTPAPGTEMRAVRCPSPPGTWRGAAPPLNQATAGGRNSFLVLFISQVFFIDCLLINALFTLY